MIICDSCRTDGGKITQAFGDTQFSVQSGSETSKPQNGDVIHLCHDCQKRVQATVSLITWTIRERGIEALNNGIRAIRA